MQDCDSLSEIFGVICILKFKFLWGGGESSFSERYFSGNTDYLTPSAGSEIKSINISAAKHKSSKK